MILSILIPTLPERGDQFNNLLMKLMYQNKGKYKLEIVGDDHARGTITTGQKRNNLIERATGKYIVFIDDDDDIVEYYLDEIFAAIKLDPDVITFNGFMTTNGTNQVDWEIRLGHPYINQPRNGKDYYMRFPNHLCPMKKELIKDFKFKDITVGEDYEWAKRIHDAGVLKTEVIINKVMYHYKYQTK